MKKIRLFFCLIVFFIFTSCGYEPIYSKNANTNKELLSISVQNIKNRPGQILRNTLLNQLNPERERVITKYRLIVEIFESKSSLAYRKDMSATRTDLEVTANYLLKDIKNGEILLKQEAKSISSFDVVESVYATLIAEKDVREKNLKVISNDIYTNLVIFFKNK
jgi:LPS-assembly lipoprotein